MRYAISSHHAMIINLNSYTYLFLRAGFEKLADRVPFARVTEKRFNSLALRLAKPTSNPELLGPHLFDAVELHLTDPRIFYNRLEWKISDRTVKGLRIPIASFHAHIEKSPLLGRYTFNLCDASARMRKAIRGQLEAAYRILRAHPASVMTENPVIVFHAGVARDEDDYGPAQARLRENVEFLAETNRRLYTQYGRDRKVVPTIENSPNEKGCLCQTLDECKAAIRGFSDEVKLTLDYGHALTAEGGRQALLRGLRDENIARSIVSLHMHYSPEVNKKARHVHAPLSKIPQANLRHLGSDLREMMRLTAIRNQGYVTLETPSGDPLDYMPWLRRRKRLAAFINRFLNGTRLFEFSAYQGTMKDQFASLAILRGMIERNDDLGQVEPASV